MPRVSIIIYYQNEETGADEAFHSVFSQTFQDFETIIVTDAPAGKSGIEPAKQWHESKTKVLRVADHQQRGSAKNEAVRAATGEYICCLHANDRYHPDFLSKTVEALDRDRQKQMAFVTTWARDLDNEAAEWRVGGYDPVRLGIENVVHRASLYRRECWGKAGGYVNNMSRDEDWDLWISMAELGYRWVCIEEVLFYYKEQEENVNLPLEGNRSLRLAALIDAHESFFKKNFRAILIEAVDGAHKSQKLLKGTEKALAATEHRLKEAEKRLREAETSATVARNESNNILNSFAWQAAVKLGRLVDKILPVETKRRTCFFYSCELAAKWIRIATKPRSKRIINTEWNNNQPLVSIIIPCYNYGNYIEEALSSALGQTFGNIEVLVVDGGSTDEYTLQTLRSMNKPKTAIYLRSGRHLVGSNRNFGIAKARGKYICCLDADDCLRPTYLEKALFYLEKYHYDVVYPSAQCFGDSNRLWIVNDTSFRDNLEAGNQVPTVAVFRKSAWVEAGGFKDWPVGVGYVPEDWEFWTRLMGNGFRFKRLKEPLMLYRVHGEGLMAQSATPVEAQKTIVKNETQKLLSKKNLRLVAKRNSLRYIVEKPYLNLKKQRVPNAKNILFVLPALYAGGTRYLLLALARHLTDHYYNIAIVTTDRPADLFDDSVRAYEEITPEVYHLHSFLQNQFERQDFLFYLIEAKNIDVLFVIGSEFGYRMMPKIKARCHQVKIIDQIFGPPGRMNNNRIKHSKYIDLSIVANETIEKTLVTRYQESPEKIRVIEPAAGIEGKFHEASIGRMNNAYRLAFDDVLEGADKDTSGQKSSPGLSVELPPENEMGRI